MAVPKSVCGFKTTELIGDGAESDVYAVKDQHVVLKVARNRKDYERFGIRNIIEIDILSRLRHPNLLYGLKLVTAPDHRTGVGIVLPRGVCPLPYNSHILDEAGLTRILDRFFQIACALHFLHSRNICHFDVKPVNILLIQRSVVNETRPDSKGNDDLIPLLADFDIAYQFHDAVKGDRLQREIITIHWRPPELLSREHFTIVKGTRSDVWSLGLVLLNMLSGVTMTPEAEFNVNNVRATLERRVLDPDYLEATLERLIPNSTRWIQLLNLLHGMLDGDPKQRLSMSVVVSHPLFEGRPVIGGSEVTIPAPVTADEKWWRATADHLVGEFNQLVTAVKCHASLAVILLALDLVYRSTGLVKAPPDQAVHRTACHLMAWKYYNHKVPLDHDDVELFVRGDVKLEALLDMEKAVVMYLNGLIYRPYIYEALQTAEHLVYVYFQIIPVSQLYNAFSPLTLKSISGTTPLQLFYNKPLQLPSAKIAPTPSTSTPASTPVSTSTPTSTPASTPVSTSTPTSTPAPAPTTVSTPTPTPAPTTVPAPIPTPAPTTIPAPTPVSTLISASISTTVPTPVPTLAPTTTSALALAPTPTPASVPAKIMPVRVLTPVPGFRPVSNTTAVAEVASTISVVPKPIVPKPVVLKPVISAHKPPIVPKLAGKPGAVNLASKPKTDTTSNLSTTVSKLMTKIFQPEPPPKPTLPVPIEPTLSMFQIGGSHTMVQRKAE